MPGNELSEFFHGIPFFTRWWFSGSILLSFLAKFGIIDSVQLILIWEGSYKYQLWRPITALFFYPISPKTDKFHGKPADYFFLLCFSWLLSVVFGYILETYILMDLMVMTIIYIWCQYYRDDQVTFWFGLQFQAKYLPWVLLLFNYIVNGSFISEAVGIIIGHVYYFFTDQYPREYGGQIMLKTPAFFYRLFPCLRTFVGGEAAPARGPTNNNSGVPPRFPGRGRALGDD